MSPARRTLRQTLTVARRDFVATVFTPAFLLFLFAPAIMMSFGLIGGLGAAGLAGSGAGRQAVVAIVPADQADTVRAIDRQLRAMLPKPPDGVPKLRIEMPSGNPAEQARALLDSREVEAIAILYGPLDRPQILYEAPRRRFAEYLAQVAEQSVRAQRVGSVQPLSQATIRPAAVREQVTQSGNNRAAFFATFGLFFLTLLLAGQAVGTMAEERSNKVIEVLAAAVPLESVFLGKLIGMFGVALLFLCFWGTVLGSAGRLLPPGMSFAQMGPAVGVPAFGLLFFAYFAMAYLLLGAVFLGVGAQASTQREIQMLSLPITIFQVAMFGFSSAAASQPGTWVATAAEIFPFSSPFAMAAHAANDAALWPHALALAWQALWVALTVTVGARWFRRGVLQSGSPKLKLFGRK